MQCETLSHRGVGQLLDTIFDVRRFTNPALEVMGVLPTLYDARPKHSRAVLETIATTYGVTVLESADPAVDQVRGSAGGRPVDPAHGPVGQGSRRLPRAGRDARRPRRPIFA